MEEQNGSQDLGEALLPFPKIGSSSLGGGGRGQSVLRTEAFKKKTSVCQVDKWKWFLYFILWTPMEFSRLHSLIYKVKNTQTKIRICSKLCLWS